MALQHAALSGTERLLSELSKAGAAAIASRCGLDALIFPAPRDLSDLSPGSDMSVANKLVALLPDGTSPQESAKHAKEEILRRLHDLRDEALTGALYSSDSSERSGRGGAAFGHS